MDAASQMGLYKIIPVMKNIFLCNPMHLCLLCYHSLIFVSCTLYWKCLSESGLPMWACTVICTLSALTKCAHFCARPLKCRDYRAQLSQLSDHGLVSSVWGSSAGNWTWALSCRAQMMWVNAVSFSKERGHLGHFQPFFWSGEAGVLIQVPAALGNRGYQCLYIPLESGGAQLGSCSCVWSVATYGAKL